MAIAFVLGNGQSRRSIDPADLKKFGRVYGCNALYRTFAPDCLVATDRPIAQEIQNSGYSLKHTFYTRRPLPNQGAKVLPKKYFGNSSGPAAIALAALDGHRRIYMLGFDMGPNGSGKFNNIYADTEFYKSSKDTATFTGNWIRQIQIICRDFPQHEFVRVIGDVTAPVPEIHSMPNLKAMPMAAFVNQLSNSNSF
jgi:hypothetical protein